MSHPAVDNFVDFAGWAAGVVLLFLGCCPPPPTVPTTTAPAATPAERGREATVDPSEQPAGQPDCTSTLKACKSTDSTRLAINDTAASFHPPTGWTYAKEAAQSVSFSPDRTAMLAFTVAASDSKNDLIAASKRLSARLHIKSVKYAWLTPRLKKAQLELEAGPHEIALWEVNKSSQFGASPKLEGELAGTFLLVAANVEGHGVFVGTAFVTKPGGDEHAAAVMESLKTFRVEGASTAKKENQGEPDK